MQKEILCNEKGEDEPGIRWERHILRALDIDFISWVKVYEKGDLHPADLKNTVVFYLNEMIKPIRDYFETNKHAKELYEEIKKYSITR